MLLCVVPGLRPVTSLRFPSPCHQPARLAGTGAHTGTNTVKTALELTAEPLLLATASEYAPALAAYTLKIASTRPVAPGGNDGALGLRHERRRQTALAGRVGIEHAQNFSGGKRAAIQAHFAHRAVVKSRRGARQSPAEIEIETRERRETAQVLRNH